MDAIKQVYQYSCCSMGMHVPPPARYPAGPVVADCPYCGKTCYFYGLTAYGLGGPPVLRQTTFHVLAPAR